MTTDELRSELKPTEEYDEEYDYHDEIIEIETHRLLSKAMVQLMLLGDKDSKELATEIENFLEVLEGS